MSFARAPALAALLLAGCAEGASPRRVVDAHLYDLTRPGITCMRGLHHDEARGCTGDAAPGDAVLRVTERNAMGNGFELVAVLYALDGHVLYFWNKEPGSAPRPTTLPIFHAAVPPGAHVIEARLIYRGHGYGVFSYLDGYKFEVRSSHAFTAPPGYETPVTMIGEERGGVTTPIEERPAVRWADEG